MISHYSYSCCVFCVHFFIPPILYPHETTPSVEEDGQELFDDQDEQVSESLEFSLVFDTLSSSEEIVEQNEENSEEELVSEDDSSSSEVVCRTVLTVL